MNAFSQFARDHNLSASRVGSLLLLLLLLASFFAFSSAMPTMNPNDSLANATSASTTLVVGATGATGKWVVKLLLDQGQHVKVVVRSKDRMLNTLRELEHDDDPSESNNANLDNLFITEASLLDLSDDDIEALVKDCDAVVSCLGHNLDFKGLFGHPRRLVTEATQRLTTAMAATSTPSRKTRFVLMGSDGVSNPNGQDDKRTFGERTILFLLRYLIPPHADNEAAAAYIHSLGTGGNVEWSVVRPTDLVNGKPTGKFQLFDKPQGGLFGAGSVTRSHVAQCMTQFILDDEKWNQYKFKMPVLHDVTADASKSEL